MRIVIGLTQFIIGVYFVFSGISSYREFPEFLAEVSSLELALLGIIHEPLLPLPEWLNEPLAYVLPGAQILFGIMFAVGIWVRYTGLVLIAILVPIVLAFGLFPHGLLEVNRMAFNKDLIFIMAILICVVFDFQRVLAAANVRAPVASVVMKPEAEPAAPQPVVSTKQDGVQPDPAKGDFA